MNQSISPLFSFAIKNLSSLSVSLGDSFVVTLTLPERKGDLYSTSTVGQGSYFTMLLL